VSECTERHKAH